MEASGTFRGRLADFAAVRTLAEAFGDAAGVERTVLLRVILVLEELFTNTITHGYPPGAEGPIWVRLAARAKAIEVLYEDAGPPFDPLSEAPGAPDPAHVDEDRPVGGLGLALVLGLSTDVSYARVDARNRITLTVPAAELPHS
jgi:serine/threonine-protein kinase RsbW